mmetsp:Transcript_18984/g.31031  ORF Transcript_18984/g.31031 Transcript_18984/m.31031 type:complete len:119 (+) Transcript_18984:39-395(+)
MFAAGNMVRVVGLWSLVCLFVCALGSEEGGDVLAVEHSFGPGVWKERGTIGLTVNTEKKKVALRFSTTSLNFEKDDREAFDALLKNNGFYRVRIRSQFGDSWLTASIPACVLAAGGFC